VNGELCIYAIVTVSTVVKLELLNSKLRCPDYLI
jgi:hypothetical protein